MSMIYGFSLINSYRQLWCENLVHKGAEKVNLKSFKYYDRMLPAQDILPKDGVGNLIALPLQGKALRDGNSAFIDSNWNAYPNQWEILWGKPRLSQEFIETKIREWRTIIEDFVNKKILSVFLIPPSLSIW